MLLRKFIPLALFVQIPKQSYFNTFVHKHITVVGFKVSKIISTLLLFKDLYQNASLAIPACSLQCCSLPQHTCFSIAKAMAHGLSVQLQSLHRLHITVRLKCQCFSCYFSAAFIHYIEYCEPHLASTICEVWLTMYTYSVILQLKHPKVPFLIIALHCKVQSLKSQEVMLNRN